MTLEQRPLDGDSTSVFAPSGETQVARLTELLQAALERNRQLEHALESRVVIEQAKGVLVERLRVEPETAFAILRHAARSSRRRLHDLASDVVRSRSTPREVAQVLAERFVTPSRTDS